jgi:hypothetical protein
MNNSTKSKALFGFTTIALCLIAILLLACNQPFDPRGDLDQKPVVFLVLSTDRDVQFVRVERSYMPEGYDPLAYTADNSLSNATVSISNGGMTMRLRDTTLPRSDTSRFKFPLRAYVGSPFRPVYGGSYNINIWTNGSETASKSIVVPMKPALGIDAVSLAVVDRPGGYDKDASILLSMILGKGAYGYRARMYVDYEVLKGSEWVEERVEIPTAFASASRNDYSFVIYPQFTRSSSNNHASGNHKNDVYSRTLTEVAYVKYGSTKIVFNRVVVQLLQVDRNLYGYYMTTHTYGDPHSIRLDEPVFLGVTGGVGLMGAYTLDSLVHILPENFAYDHY